MYATGVPALILVSREVRQISEQFEAERNTCRNDIREFKETVMHQIDAMRTGMPHHTIIHTSSINNKATQYTHTHLTLSA
mmetsp:Transcript_18795/g.27154  ORF Transcript_18795/g.27154 Transcript_18795/m.27154 type:complete len:80 (+) Transcript_18795:436-675(+)